MESKVIPTQTTLNVIATTITLTTVYVDVLLSGVIKAFISETIGGELVDGVPFIEGEGGITIKDTLYPNSLNFIKNSSGELLVTAPNASKFGVNTVTGELIYTS